MGCTAGLRCQWLHGIRRPESPADLDQALSSPSGPLEKLKQITIHETHDITSTAKNASALQLGRITMARKIGTSVIGDHFPEHNSLLTRLVASRQNHSYIGVPTDPVHQLHIRAEETPPFVILQRGGNKTYRASNWPLALLSIVLAVSLLWSQSPARNRNIRLIPEDFPAAIKTFERRGYIAEVQLPYGHTEDRRRVEDRGPRRCPKSQT